MYRNGDICPICGSGALTKKVIKETFEYKGKHLTIENYVVYECNECEESIVDKKTIEDTEFKLINFRRQVDNLLTPGEIRELRKRLNFTQEKFGLILGGGKKAFARYEGGIVTQSRAMDNLLKAIRKSPELINIYLNKKADPISTNEIDHEVVAKVRYSSYEDAGMKKDLCYTSTLATTFTTHDCAAPNLFQEAA